MNDKTDCIPTTASDEEVPATDAPEGAARAGSLDDGSSDWARPVAQARDRNFGAWLALAGLVCFAIALRGPANRLYWRVRNRVSGPQPIVERTADSFLALSYEAVSASPGAEALFTPVVRFREHVEALRAAGYNPVGLADVKAFYERGEKLPDKAVLLTFENTHKSTYFDATPVLRAARWRGVLGVVTGDVREKSPDSVLAPYLRNMVLDNVWDLACESDRGLERVQTGSDGSTGPFYASPAWLAAAKRPESPEEFESRIRADHEAARSVFSGSLHTAPGAFFFPDGNYGQYDGRRSTRATNLALVGEFYGIGFSLGSRALNTAGTDPRRLNRLRVAPEWSAEELLARLEREWPTKDGFGSDGGRVPPARWSPDWGTAETEGSTLCIRALPPTDPLLSEEGATGGARSWIAGSDGFAEGSVDLRFVPLRGDFQVYVPFASDDEWVRIELSASGRAAVKASSPGSGIETLASCQLPEGPFFGAVHSLLVAVRDGLLFARFDNVSLFGGPVSLPQDVRPGLVGAGVWDEKPGLAQVNVLESRLRSRVDCIVTWQPALSRDDALLSMALRRDAFRNAVVAPPWLDARDAAPVELPRPDPESLALVARACRSRVMPRVAVRGVGALPALDPEGLAARAASLGVDGVFVDAADFPAGRISRLREWAAALSSRLSRRSLSLAVRLPEAAGSSGTAESFFASIQGAFAVVAPGAVGGASPLRVLFYAELQAPTDGDDGNAAAVYQLSDYDDAPAEDLPEATKLRMVGLRAYSEGRYADASESWQHWTALSPDDPEAWALLGNARNRLLDASGAVDAYGRSLDLSPGNVDTALERARLLEKLGRDAEAGSVLDTYARAFPGDARIAVAQALWLDRHHRRSAGRDMLRKVVERNPADVDCRLALQRLLDDPAERHENLREMLRAATSGPGGLLGFGSDIERSELLASPEAGVFFDFIRSAAANATSESVRNLYSGFVPMEEPVLEQFDSKGVSDNWTAFGTPLAAIAGAYDLRAAADMSEAYLRLRHSDLLRDGFIEVSLSESAGMFWLYARRSSRSMVRFGFAGDGYLRIQAWSDGELRAADSKAWTRPGGDVTLRLEIRGDGAIGLVDGKPCFQTPLPVPADIAYGWWSVAPFSPELGMARARITRIAAGPLQPSFALIRETGADRVASVLDSLRLRAPCLSAVSPVLFEQRQDGTIHAEPLDDAMPYRMFCAYHRLRLMPAVTLGFESRPDPKALVALARRHRFSGLVLLARSMPPEEWFDVATDMAEASGVNLIVIASPETLLPEEEEAGNGTGAARIAALAPVRVRETQRGSVMLLPSRREWSAKPVSPDALPTLLPDVPGAAPRVVIVPPVDDEAQADTDDNLGTLDEALSEK